jgi:hypothetical protein
MAKKKTDVLDDDEKVVSKRSSVDDMIEESSEEVLSTNIPPFCKGKYLVVKKTHPKSGKDTRDGFVLSLILISHLDAKGIEEKLVVVEKEGEGKKATIEISFPKGTSGLMATIYSGPKSTIKFVKDKKWYQVDKKKFDYKYFLEWYSKKNPLAKKMDDDELDEAYVEYLEKFYDFGLSQQFGVESDVVPTPGMATYFYRKYAPAKEGEKYGQTNISKWAGGTLKDKFPTIDGKYSKVDEAVTEKILEAYMATKVKKDDVSFNYGDNSNGPVEEDVI